jgi:DNA-binding transcriptional MerR regulator
MAGKGHLRLSCEHEEEELEKLAELLDRRERGQTAGPVRGAGPVAERPGQEQVSPQSPDQGEDRAVPRGAVGGGSYTFAEVCSLLNLSPYTLRGLLADYGDVLGLGGIGQEEVPTGKRRLPEWAFRLLKEVVALRNAGLSREEIRDRLRALAEAAAGLALVPGYQGPGGSGQLVRYVDRATARDLLLIEKIEHLSEQLARSEQKRAEDRDRLLMALLRTQQEIQQLRYELVARGTRRDRKRRSIWARLFGRG